MVRLRLDLDGETYERLLDAALAERRPVPWQAEMIIRRVLGAPHRKVRPNAASEKQVQEIPELSTPEHHTSKDA